MLIGKVLRFGYISREKISVTNARAPMEISCEEEVHTAPLVTVDALLGVMEQTNKTDKLEKTRV